MRTLTNAHGVRLGAVALAGVLALLVAAPARAQETHRANPETTPRERQVKDAVVETGPLRKSEFGTKLTNAEAVALLREMRQLTEQALAATRAAEQASSVAEIKAAAERALLVVWGQPSGVPSGAADGAIRSLGWKERWQVTGGEFDPAFVARYGAEPPKITDPRQLGIMGRGRAVRGRLEEISSNSSRAVLAQDGPVDGVLASLNNVIGWTYITTGFKGREVQPRISLTHVWDAPVEFWNSTADTGWLREVYAQATNILKTDYNGDVAEARKHVAALSEFLQKVLQGVDADKNGIVEAKPMEGGLVAAIEQATRSTLRGN